MQRSGYQGYMIVADGNPLETTKRETREFKIPDAQPSTFHMCQLTAFSVFLVDALLIHQRRN